MPPPANPELFCASPGGGILLKGMRCPCGHVAFPYQGFGCERCGADRDLERLDLAAAGSLAAAAVVHIPPGPAPRAPFAIGAVKLDAGPMIRVRLAGDPQPGDRVRGELAACDDEGSLDLRFSPWTS